MLTTIIATETFLAGIAAAEEWQADRVALGNLKPRGRFTAALEIAQSQQPAAESRASHGESGLPEGKAQAPNRSTKAAPSSWKCRLPKGDPV